MIRPRRETPPLFRLSSCWFWGSPCSAVSAMSAPVSVSTLADCTYAHDSTSRVRFAWQVGVNKLGNCVRCGALHRATYRGLSGSVCSRFTMCNSLVKPYSHLYLCGQGDL